MSKYIKVESCCNCPCIGSIYYDDKDGILTHAHSGCRTLKVDVYNYAKAKTTHLDCPLDDEVDSKLLERKYYELLHYIQTKYPEESRHDTALRYINEKEKIRQDLKDKGVGK